MSTAKRAQTRKSGTKLVGLAACAATCIALYGCGSSSKTKTVTVAHSTVTQNKTTASTTTPLVTTATRSSAPLPRLRSPIHCGHGVTSDAYCRFALATATTFRRLWDEGGVPQSGFRVRTTPQICIGYADNSWICHTPRNRTQGGSFVYTAFVFAGPGHRASQPSQSSSSVAASPPTGNAKSFSGNGAANIGTVNVPSASTIHWTNDGALFQVLDFGINSQGHGGTSALAAGKYPNVEVNALGNWTLKIIPNS